MNRWFEAFAGCILELNRCLQRIKENEMKKFGLRGGHAMCLYYLSCHEEGLTAGQLTELCREDKGAMSRSLAELVKLGIIFNDREEGKRTYRTRYFLTPAGREVTDQMNERIAHALSSGGYGMKTEVRAHFYEAMQLILNNLSRYDGEEN
ncbi:MAG: replication-relaxation family protein [Lachnospiraceae bacterium]|nr:replication-relaxation family protein [Lachnospiraceae bacterium]